MDFTASPEDNTILFYGGMGSPQNIKAFFRFFQNILPKVKTIIPEIKCIIVGSDPHKSITKLHNGKNVVVTGYVDDVREHISKSAVMILPLSLGAGFRSRMVEVMAMGVPVVGTHNALDNIEMTHKKQGFISDSDDEMANYLVTVLSDTSLREKMSNECKKFVLEKYSIESTYGRLSDYYQNL